jgi:hypothetical protein
MKHIIMINLFVCRAESTHHTPDVDDVTYDVIGNQGPEYEVIKKRKRDVVRTPPTKTREFNLSECPAYDPVSTPASQREQSTEYELMQAMSSM